MREGREKDLLELSFLLACRWLNKEFLVLENGQVISQTDMRKFALRINSKPLLLNLKDVFTVNYDPLLSQLYKINNCCEYIIIMNYLLSIQVVLLFKEFDSSKNDSLSKDDFCKMYESIIQEKKVTC